MATKPTYPVNLGTRYVPPPLEHGPRMVPVPFDESHYIVDPSAQAVSAGIPEAPADGNVYGRQNTAWAQIVYPPPQEIPPPAIATDAPSDSTLYTRVNGTWVRVPALAATQDAIYLVRTNGNLWMLPTGGTWTPLPAPASGNARIIQVSAYALPGSNEDVLVAACTQGAGVTWVYYTMQVQVPYTWTVLPMPP